MFQSIHFRFAFALLVLAATSLNVLANDNDLIITLRAGTPISLTLNQTVSSNDAQIGNVVECMVRSNVTVNGQVVIAAGSIAEGMVTQVTKTCPGCPARCSELVITVKTVRAVDGQHVALRGLPITIRGECCGMCHEPVVVERGCPLPAETQHPTPVHIDAAAATSRPRPRTE